MKRLLLALLATQNLAQAYAGVIMVDESATKRQAVSASVAAAPAVVQHASPKSDGPNGKAAAPVPVTPKTWEVRATDGTVYGTLKRWSKDAGMQLMWETENHDLRLRGQATYTGDFDAAVLELMKSVEHSDYPIRACIYDNGAVRVLHIKKSCKG